MNSRMVEYFPEIFYFIYIYIYIHTYIYIYIYIAFTHHTIRPDVTGLGYWQTLDDLSAQEQA